MPLYACACLFVCFEGDGRWWLLNLYSHFLPVYMYVCIVITYNKRKDQPGKVANPARGQLNRVCEALDQHARA